MNQFHTNLVIGAVIIAIVDSMVVKGPPITRYDPCDQGYVFLDRYRRNQWQGTVNFGLFGELEKAVVNIHFERGITIYGTSHSTKISQDNEGKSITLKIKGVVPDEYYFYISISELKDNETDLLAVTNLSINDESYCNKDIRDKFTVESFNELNENEIGVQSHVCGRRSLEHSEITTVNNESEPGEWPWHVAIMYKKSSTSNELLYECGGTIISKTTVLTAAHCFKYSIQAGHNIAEKIAIAAGMSDYNSNYSIGLQVRRAERVIVHPSYYDPESTSDLAIVKVKEFDYTEYVQPICLWGPVYDKKSLFGMQGTVMGFGANEEYKFTGKLKSMYVMIHEDEICSSYSPDLYIPLMNEFTICVGNSPTIGANPRNGDSGGGLILPIMQADNKISWYLRAVLSKCGTRNKADDERKVCDPSFYLVYTDVGPHFAWINHHTDFD